MDESRRKATAIVVGCILLFIVFGTNVVLYVVQNNRIVTENTERRKALELSNCITSNVRALATRTALKNSLVALVPSGAVLSEDQKARIDAYDKEVDAQLPYRACTPDAIRYYIEHPPIDPAAPAPVP